MDGYRARLLRRDRDEIGLCIEAGRSISSVGGGLAGGSQCAWCHPPMIMSHSMLGLLSILLVAPAESSGTDAAYMHKKGAHRKGSTEQGTVQRLRESMMAWWCPTNPDQVPCKSFMLLQKLRDATPSEKKQLVSQRREEQVRSVCWHVALLHPANALQKKPLPTRSPPARSGKEQVAWGSRQKTPWDAGPERFQDHVQRLLWRRGIPSPLSAK